MTTNRGFEPGCPEWEADDLLTCIFYYLLDFIVNIFEFFINFSKFFSSFVRFCNAENDK